MRNNSKKIKYKEKSTIRSNFTTIHICRNCIKKEIEDLKEKQKINISNIISGIITSIFTIYLFKISYSYSSLFAFMSLIFLFIGFSNFTQNKKYIDIKNKKLKEVTYNENN